MRLTLKKDTLHELTADELTSVVGGRIPTWYSGCVTTIYPSIGEETCIPR